MTLKNISFHPIIFQLENFESMQLGSLVHKRNKETIT